MNRTFRTALPLVALVALLAAPCASAQDARLGYDRLGYDRLIRPDDGLYHRTPLGLCEDYPEESTTLDIIRKDMEVLKRSGVDLLRISFGWDSIEAEKDQYDWLFWDDFVRIAVDEYGITLVPYICYTPRWNATRESDMEFWRSAPADIDEFGEFMGDLVGRYKDRIKTWELWNEPDIEWFWIGSQERFTELLRVGSEAVRQADPEATIVMGGLAHDVGWLQSLLRDHGAARYFDVVNMHNYYETWQDYPQEDMAGYINRIADVVDRYGEGEPLWMAEVGYSTYRNGSYVSNDYSAYYDYEHTPAYQAVDLVRRLTTALSTGKLSAVTWYELKDLPPKSDTIGDQQNNSSLGVANYDHTPKPAEGALAFARRLYGEPMRSLDEAVVVTKSIGSDAYVHTFEQEDGDVIVVGWLQTRVPGRQGDLGGDGMHRDDRRETVSVDVPRRLAGAATAYDALGTAAAFEARTLDADGTTLSLDLAGGGVTVVVLEKD